jgi:hypothetical protein
LEQIQLLNSTYKNNNSLPTISFASNWNTAQNESSTKSDNKPTDEKHKSKENTTSKNTKHQNGTQKIQNFPDPLVAIHKVKWNPNLSSFKWIIYGGKSGLLRCQLIKWVA